MNANYGLVEIRRFIRNRSRQNQRVPSHCIRQNKHGPATPHRKFLALSTASSVADPLLEIPAPVKDTESWSHRVSSPQLLSSSSILLIRAKRSLDSDNNLAGRLAPSIPQRVHFDGPVSMLCSTDMDRGSPRQRWTEFMRARRLRCLLSSSRPFLWPDEGPRKVDHSRPEASELLAR